VKKIFLLSLPSPLPWKLLPYALLELVIMYVRGDEHFCTRFEQPLQNRAREGCSEAAVHAVEVNVKVNRECLEIRERGARTRNPLAYLMLVRSEGCD
jgi:hypothetical protein